MPMRGQGPQRESEVIRDDGSRDDFREDAMTYHDPAAEAAERYRFEREREAARERELRRIREERGAEPPRRRRRARGRGGPTGDYGLAV
ncbi:hypothetical protein SUDANB121_04266 [Nocardiopsis dassonvillei]